MSKIVITRKPLITMKNGSSAEVVEVKASNNNDPMTYDDITKLLKGIESKGADLKNFQVVGLSKAGTFTIKGMDEDFDDKYMVNKPTEVRSALDGFYKIHMIQRFSNNKK